MRLNSPTQPSHSGMTRDVEVRSSAISVMPNGVKAAMETATACRMRGGSRMLGLLGGGLGWRGEFGPMDPPVVGAQILPPNTCCQLDGATVFWAQRVSAMEPLVDVRLLFPEQPSQRRLGSTCAANGLLDGRNGRVMSAHTSTI